MLPDLTPHNGSRVLCHNSRGTADIIWGYADTGGDSVYCFSSPVGQTLTFTRRNRHAAGTEFIRKLYDGYTTVTDEQLAVFWVTFDTDMQAALTLAILSDTVM